MKKLLLFFSLFFVPYAMAANTATINGTIADSGGTTWTYASWQAVLVGTVNAHYKDGTPVVTSVSGYLSSGVISGTLGRNDMIAAPNTTWTFTICPYVSAPCQVVPGIVISSATVNVATVINPQLVPVSILSTGTPITAFTDSEISNPKNAPYNSVQPTSGQLYYNPVSDQYNYWSIATQSWKTFVGNSVSYNDSATSYVWYSDSLFNVSTTNTITATSVSCDGANCVVTAPNSYTVGQPVQFSGTWSPTCLNYVIASVESAGLNSTQFEVSETNLLGVGSVGSVGCSGNQTGTGGTVQDASYFAPFAVSKLPYLNNHGTNYDYGLSGGTSTDMVNNYTTMIHPHTTAVTHNPSFIILKVSVNDWTGGIGGNCFTPATTEANLQNLWERIHADGSQVIMMTSQSWPYNGIVCDGGVGANNAATVNDWVRGQGPSSSASGQPAGAYWDRLVDVASVFTNYNDTNFRLASYHLNDGGNAYLAALTNQAFGVQGSVIQSLVSSVCGANNDIACLNEANTFAAGQTIRSHTPSINLTNTDTGGGSASWTVWGSNGMSFFQFNGRNTMAWWPLNGGSGNGLTLQADQCYAWDDATGGAFLLADAPDTAICRDGGNTFDFGNGTYQNKTATLKFGQLSMGAIAPSGACTIVGNWQFTQDGKSSYCNGTTWITISSLTGGQWLTSTSNCTASGSSYATCTNSVINWPTAFPDTNYKVVCSGKGPSNGTGPAGSVSGDIFNYTKTTTGLTLVLQTNTSSGFSYSEIDCYGSE